MTDLPNPPAVTRLPDGSINWTEELVSWLRAAMTAGLSSRAAADRLGVTKNSVVGKASRLGFKFDGDLPVASQPDYTPPQVNAHGIDRVRWHAGNRPLAPGHWLTWSAISPTVPFVRKPWHFGWRNQ